MVSKRIMVLLCGDVTQPDLPVFNPVGDTTCTVHQVSRVPSRQELRVLDNAAREILPVDPTPSLDDIAAQPDVAHLGTPGFAPQQVTTALRVIVVGTDAALSAVLTRIMRADYMWVEVGFVPHGASTAAHNWALPASAPAALHLSLTGEVRPVPLIRNDAGVAVAGSATITNWDGGQLEGEIIVDDAVLTRTDHSPSFGARLVPMLDAPGIAAARAVTPFTGPLSLFDRLRRKTLGQLDPDSVLSGRAVQAGGPKLLVTIDGIPGKRPVKRSTFYRHLRDLQIVR